MIWRFSVTQEEAINIIDRVIKDTATTAETDQLISFILTVVKSHQKVSTSMADAIGMTYDELVDDLEVHIWSQLGNYDPSKGALTSFIYRAVTSRVSDKYKHVEFRKQKRIPRSKILSLFKELATTGDTEAVEAYEDLLVERHLTPEEEALYADMVEEIKRRVSARDEVSARILDLKLEGYTDYEIAQRLKMRPTVVMQKKERVIFPAALEVTRG